MAPQLATTEAHVYVRDIQAACAFYRDKLGFSIAFLYGEPPYYGQVRRGEGRLALRQVCEPVFVSDIRAREDLLSASFTLPSATDLTALFAEFELAGVAFKQRCERKPWGAHNFIVCDPDGNLILFAAPADT